MKHLKQNWKYYISPALLLCLLLASFALAEEFSLPIDFSGGYKPDPDAYTATSYEESEAAARLETSSAAAVRTGNGYLLACYDVQLDESGCLKEYRRIEKDEPAVGTKW